VFLITGTIVLRTNAAGVSPVRSANFTMQEYSSSVNDGRITLRRLSEASSAGLPVLLLFMLSLYYIGVIASAKMLDSPSRRRPGEGNGGVALFLDHIFRANVIARLALLWVTSLSSLLAQLQLRQNHSCKAGRLLC